MKSLILTLIILAGFIPTFAQTNIVAMEYFLDTDPGNGNGTPIPLTSGPVVSETLSISTAALSIGSHFLYVRALDENGVWSLTVKRAFMIQATPVPLPSATQITAMEYFIDNDPGNGNGTPITITPAPNVNVSLNIDVSSLSNGIHFLFIRTQDDLGVWSSAEKRPFQVNAPAAPLGRRIVRIEYFFDTDPGVGSGSQIDINPINTLSVDTVLNSSSLAIGPHNLGVRVQDEQGTWSTTEISAVTVCDGPNPDFAIDLNCLGLQTNFTDNSIDVVAGDIYRWDFDGDGNFDDFTVGNTSFTYPAPGIYTVQLQIEPVSGCIGNFFQQVEIIDVPLADFSANDGCVGQAVSFNDLSQNIIGPATYEWDFDGDAVIDDLTTGSTQFSYGAAGNYSATLTVTTGLGCVSQQIINVVIDDIPNAPSVQGASGFRGESLTLTASGGTNGQYRWYESNTNTPIPGEFNSSLTTPALISTRQYFVSIVSTNLACESTRIPVEAVIQDPKLEVYNVVTVNPNGKHDFLKIVNIEEFPNNQVIIYNRWGDKVFEIDGYNNTDAIFTGIDQNGNELPDGNYYYVIDKNNGDSAQNGYLLLRR